MSSKNIWQVGDAVEWDRHIYKKKLTKTTVERGRIIAIIDGTSAIVDKGKWQRREMVYLTRLRRWENAPALPPQELINAQEYAVLVTIWQFSPSEKPRGVKYRTMNNLVGKGLLFVEKRGEITQYWLTNEGKRVMDQYPHGTRAKATT